MRATKQFAARQKMAEAQMEQMTQMINEVDAIKFGWAVDSQQQRTYADFQAQFLPDSKMAKQMAAYEGAEDQFRRLLPARCRGDHDDR